MRPWLLCWYSLYVWLTYHLLGNIIEDFFDIDIERQDPTENLQRFRGLSQADLESTGSTYGQIFLELGGVYTALDRKYQRIFVLFADAYSMVYGVEDGKKVMEQAMNNIQGYSRILPPELPLDDPHFNLEQWLLQDIDRLQDPAFRCGVYEWGIECKKGSNEGPALTRNMTQTPGYTQEKLLQLNRSLGNISIMKQFLLGVIDSKQRFQMQRAVNEANKHVKYPWSTCKNECFTLRTCTVNLPGRPAVDSGLVKWSIGTPLGSFTKGDLCIVELQRSFHYQPGYVSAIRGGSVVKFIRPWTGNRTDYQSTMDSYLFTRFSNLPDTENPRHAGNPSEPNSST